MDSRKIIQKEDYFLSSNLPCFGPVFDYGVRNFFDLELWDLVEEKVLKNKFEMSQSLVDKSRSDSIRSSINCWINDSSFSEYLYKIIKEFNYSISKWCFEIDSVEPLQYTIYPEGGQYNWHRDTFPFPKVRDDNRYFQRKISVTIFLNDPDEYEGGELDIETRGPKEKIRYETFKLSKGHMITFPSSTWHRVRPVTSGVRKSLVAWIGGPPFK